MDSRLLDGEEERTPSTGDVPPIVVGSSSTSATSTDFVSQLTKSPIGPGELFVDLLKGGIFVGGAYEPLSCLGSYDADPVLHVRISTDSTTWTLTYRSPLSVGRRKLTVAIWCGDLRKRGRLVHVEATLNSRTEHSRLCSILE